MNKIRLKIIPLLIIISSGIICATTQFRAPISLKRGFIHLYLPRVQKTRWYQVIYPDCYDDGCPKDCLWNDHEWHQRYLAEQPFDKAYDEYDQVYESPRQSTFYNTYQGAVSTWRDAYRKANAPLISSDRPVKYNRDDQTARDYYLEGQKKEYVQEMRPWYIYQWGGAYYRTADKSFFNSCNPCKVTTDTASLSQLFFGADSFTVEQSFVNGIITNPLLPGFSPFLSFSSITPRFDYTEKGAIFGLTVERRWGCDDEWRAGVRTSLPFKIITLNHNSDCGGPIEEGLADVIIETPFNVESAPAPNGVDYAFRLDFLTTLVRPALPPSNTQLLVQYGTPTATTAVAGIPVGLNAVGPLPPDNGIFLIKSVTGGAPAQATLPNSTKQSYGKFWQQATGPLPVTGVGTNGEVLFFAGTPTNYLGTLATNRAAQRTLWVVPRVQYTLGDTPAGTPAQLSPNAIAIYNAIQELISTLEFANPESAIAFLRSRCINLCKAEYIAGLGDLETEFYVGHGTDYWYANFILGVRWPTGKRQDDARRVYYQTTGHNGHYELKLGLEGGWKVCNWFGFKLDGFYNHAFNRVETKAAPFKGATIRNIGPNVDAKVSWDYFVAHADLDFFHPCNPDLGFVIGYELFAKRKDKVRLCAATAVDLLGNTNPLDATILEQNTNAMTHKIRGEIFHRWNFCELFVGASHAVAGKNAMQESDLSLGVAIYF